MNRIDVLSNHLCSSTITTTTTTTVVKYNDNKDPLLVSELESNHILYRIYDNGCLKIILNREKALNSLTLEMINHLLNLLKKYENDKRVTFVLVVGAGDRAYCSGGDLLEFSSSVEMSHRLSNTEYKLDYLIHTYSKPYVSIVNGIVMGGGVGISIHGSHCIVTERALWAMPECFIGYFPDVGTNYQMSRLGAIGLYLDLTGTRIKYRDLVGLGIASHHVPSDMLDRLVRDLTENTVDTTRQLDFIINLYRKQVGYRLHNIEPSTMVEWLVQNQCLERCFGNHIKSVQEVLDNLENEIKNNNGDEKVRKWAEQTLTKITGSRPLSICACFKAFRDSLNLSIDDVLKMDNRVGTHLTQIEEDGREGIKAALFDKTYKPQWIPPTIQQVDPNIVDSLFKPLPSHQELDLN
ncbi:enoyl-CoA hydratase/isomerase domain-containing protein [Cavenderia fasciculata]|uniref:Enoyl-CoA hydratase/isomerase domain-containing protein n=1 Tax=Cavenderia fasciculata TaxID=261658 RepID=F4Q929_CACFS|nr:enoyl-CoA hydratase/isomerase domain-containing protein [Cavenderia fasciculata]EGG15198.1 enoyl-CoA hydratase/isomerase domain-containing protein [Cavenderia fasciculata]|eukprot:XP_004351918.1 enoyl-CoA hydratase/isomerase domain-containing protein [Cavenderia fasciculata]